MKESFVITTLNGDTWEYDGEWDRETAIDFSFIEASAVAEAEAEERKLKWVREIIENRGMKQPEKQAGKLTGKHARSFVCGRGV